MRSRCRRPGERSRPPLARVSACDALRLARGSAGGQAEPGWTSPISYASTTAWTRSRSPSFISTFETWVLTVASPTTRASAISAFDIPAREQLEHLAFALGQLVERARGAAPTGAGSRRADAVEQLPRDRRGQQRVAGRHDSDGTDQLVGRHVLRDEAARAGAQRLDDVLVEAERRQHQHAVVWQPLDRLDPVEVGHPDVHQDRRRARSRGRHQSPRPRRRPRPRPPSRRSPRARPGTRRASTADRRRSARRSFVHGVSSSGSKAWTRKPRAVAALAGLELAPEQRDPLAHADEAVSTGRAVATGHDVGTVPSSSDRHLERVGEVGERHLCRWCAPAWRITLVSASWTIR